MARTATSLPASSTSDSEDAASDFAPLDDDIIARQTDAGSFSRGKTYFRGKRIFNAVRRGDLLRARCRGSSGGPYHVEANLAPAGKRTSRNPVRYLCTCPRGGFCKHVVALLLTWIDAPETFEVRPPIADLLADKSQEELVALIEAMVATNPDLERLIALPPPAAVKPDATPVDEAAIRHLIESALPDSEDYDEYGGGYGQFDRYAFSYGYDEYDGASYVSGTLEDVVAYADAYVEGGHWRNAMTVSAVLAEQLPSELDMYLDEGGELASLINRTDANLAACLEAQERLPAEQRFSDEERTRLIDAILAIWEADIDAGGIGLSDGGPEAIGALATPAEQERVREYLRGMILPAAGEPWKHQWQNRAVIGFLSLLKGEVGLSDEELLAEYRNAELWDDATSLLLEMDRPDEAISLASRKLGVASALIAFADQLIATGDPKRIEQAITLVDDRLWEREGQRAQDDEALRQWLERQYAAHGQPEKSLELARARFKNLPSRTTYDAVKAAALLPGQSDDPWPALRKDLLATLRKREDWYGLIDIHLGEKEVAAAIEALKQKEKRRRTIQPGWGYGWTASAGGHEARVAAAAEADFPDESIRIYRELADQLIAARGRANYQVAAEYLRRAMNVLERHGRAQEWTSLIADVRQNNKSLRALKEELDSLGLV